MADKLDMKSMDITQDNIAKIKALFPSAVTEVMGDDGKVKLAIDFDALKQELSEDLISEKAERYQMTWPDKSKANVLANSRITATLRPDKEKSVDFDNTENLYIKGDNLDILKLLRETYLGKVKVIYIDPPYNTGNDFIYEDDFTMSADDYAEISGQFDEQGNRLFQNNDANGRFHTDWLNMMYPRLKVARDLLTDDGVVFISIGQDEGYNLIKCCNEIYGESNRVGIISRMMKSGGNKGQYFSPNIEYVLVYAKNLGQLEYFREPLSDELIDKVYNLVETEGAKKGQRFRIMGLYQAGLGIRPNQRYWVECPDGSYAIPAGTTFPTLVENASKVLPQDGDGVWRWSADRYLAEIKNGNIYFKQTSTSSLLDEKGNQSKWNIYTKIWLDDRLEEGRVPVDLITKWENRVSSQELKDLSLPFDFAKPVELIKYLVGLVANTREAIVLDFFSGSATTAHAVMKLNAEDGGNRKFIMIQLPENCDEKSEAYKAGYKTICDIGQERIRRAGKKIKEEGGLTTQDLDVGFRVLKLDSSNMQEVYYNPSAMTQDILAMTVDNIKADRTPLDLLFQVMLDLGIELSAKIEENVVNGKTYYAVNGNDIIACFDDDIDNDVITAIAKQNPLYAVFKDKSFATDSVGINNEQLFKTYSPSTVVKVL